MQLLVSVATEDEAMAALQGGADVIDAKDPAAGALGPVSIERFRAIHRRVAGSRPVSAALGDASDVTAVEERCSSYSAAGACFLKLALGQVRSPDVLQTLAAAAVRGSSRSDTGTVAVIFADADPWFSRPDDFTSMVGACGVTGVLIDTARKDGPGLCRLDVRPVLDQWMVAARRHDLTMALAGRLTMADLRDMNGWPIDIAGVRGAACDGGRNGTVSAARVTALLAACSRNRQRSRFLPSPTVAGRS